MGLKIRQYQKQGKFLREVCKLLNVSHSIIWATEQGLIYQHVVETCYQAFKLALAIGTHVVLLLNIKSFSSVQ